MNPWILGCGPFANPSLSHRRSRIYHPYQCPNCNWLMHQITWLGVSRKVQPREWKGYNLPKLSVAVWMWLKMFCTSQAHISLVFPSSRGTPIDCHPGGKGVGSRSTWSNRQDWIHKGPELSCFDPTNLGMKWGNDSKLPFCWHIRLGEVIASQSQTANPPTLATFPTSGAPWHDRCPLPRGPVALAVARHPRSSWRLSSGGWATHLKNMLVKLDHLSRDYHPVSCLDRLNFTKDPSKSATTNNGTLAVGVKRKNGPESNWRIQGSVPRACDWKVSEDQSHG